MTSVVGAEASDCACTLRGYLEYGADFDENNTATHQLREACETMLKNGVVLAELQGKSLRDSYLANPGTANFNSWDISLRGHVESLDWRCSLTRTTSYRFHPMTSSEISLRIRKRLSR